MSSFHSNGSILDDRQFGSAEVANLDEGKKAYVDDVVALSVSNTSGSGEGVDRVTLSDAHHGKTIMATTTLMKVILPSTTGLATGWKCTINNGPTATTSAFAVSHGTAKIQGATNASGAYQATDHYSVTIAAASAFANSISLTYNGTNFVITACACVGDCTNGTAPL